MNVNPFRPAPTEQPPQVLPLRLNRKTRRALAAGARRIRKEKKK